MSEAGMFSEPEERSQKLRLVSVTPLFNRSQWPNELVSDTLGFFCFVFQQSKH